MNRISNIQDMSQKHTSSNRSHCSFIDILEMCRSGPDDTGKNLPLYHNHGNMLDYDANVVNCGKCTQLANSSSNVFIL
jgi:hypothetical protein